MRKQCAVGDDVVDVVGTMSELELDLLLLFKHSSS